MENKKLERIVHIAKLLDTLSEYWLDRPYMRLSQIVSNAWHIHPDYKKNPEPEIQDVFYFTDEKFLEGLELLIKNESENPRPTKE